MSREITPEAEVLRIVLLGLPYSGIEDVAQVLRDAYGCSILRANINDKP